MKTKEIVEKIRTDYGIIKSLAVNHVSGQDFIELLGMEYKGKNENFATEGQIRFLLSLNNVSCYENQLRNANKWFISACIKIARDFPKQNFNITIPLGGDNKIEELEKKIIELESENERLKSENIKLMQKEIARMVDEPDYENMFSIKK